MPRVVELSFENRGRVVLGKIRTPEHFGVDAWVTTRLGGVSRPPYDSLNLAEHVGDDLDIVTRNRHTLAEALSMERSDLKFVRQVHGTDIVHASNLDNPDTPADGLVSDEPQRLAILVADCLPLLFVDTSSSRFAVVHAGWRGLAAGIVERAVAQFERPGELYVYVGPHIEATRYQVGPEVAEHFADFPDALVGDSEDRFLLDLGRVALAQLRGAGVPDELTELSRERTDSDHFFSDRQARPTGRFALVASRSRT